MFHAAARRATRFVTKSVSGTISQKTFIAPRIMVRSMVTLQEREMSEEARFIRAKEHAEMKAKLEKILEADDSDDEKIELTKVLGGKPADEGVVSKLGLNDWKFALPIAMLVGIPAISNEVLVLSEELQLTACFVLFCSTMYTQLGGMLSKSLDEYSQDIEKKFKDVDDSMLVSLKSAQRANTELLGLENDVKSVFELKDNLATVKAETLNHEESHKFRDEIVRKLDTLAALEDSAVTALRSRMISKVKSDVVNQFKTDNTSKEAALSAAIAVLAAGDKAKMGKDVVGEAYKSAIIKYREEYKKQPDGSDEIIQKLEADIKSIIQPPVFESKGGNVYETHGVF